MAAYRPVRSSSAVLLGAGGVLKLRKTADAEREVQRVRGRCSGCLGLVSARIVFSLPDLVLLSFFVYSIQQDSFCD